MLDSYNHKKLINRFKSLPLYSQTKIALKFNLIKTIVDIEKNSIAELFSSIKNDYKIQSKIWEAIHEDWKIKQANPFSGEKGELRYYIDEVLYYAQKIIPILDDYIDSLPDKNKNNINKFCNSIYELRINSNLPGKSILLGSDLDKIIKIINSFKSNIVLPLDHLKSNSFIISWLEQFSKKSLTKENKKIILNAIEIIKKSKF